MVLCPLCERENADDATECAACGRVFLEEVQPEEELAAVPGLEPTLLDAAASSGAAPEPLAELQQTLLARRDLRIQAEVVEGLEPTQVAFDPDAASLWGGGVALDLGREPDDGARTPAPVETGLCPWCHAPSTAAVCDACGRRRARYLTPPVRAAAAPSSGETVLCPACFARVEKGPRCVECGVPFPPEELV